MNDGSWLLLIWSPVIIAHVSRGGSVQRTDQEQPLIKEDGGLDDLDHDLPEMCTNVAT